MNTTILLPHEDEFVVMIPAVFLRVYARLQLCSPAGGTAPAASRQFEPVLLQIIKCLLDERVLQKEPRRVSVRQTVVRIPRFIQRFTENIPTERHLTANEDPAQLTELDVGETVSAERKTAPIPDRDASAFTVRGFRVGFLHGVFESGQPVVSRFAREAFVFAEAFG